MRFSVILALLLSIQALGADAPKPKYGPMATRLTRSHEFFQKNPAPDYWALSPYYVGQINEASCSLASVTMALNAARASMDLTADDKLVTQEELLKKISGEIWKKALLGEGLRGGVTLDELGKVSEQSFKAYGFEHVEVEVIHAETAGSGARERVHRALVENERSAGDFILANFLQGRYTGDTDAGHISPVGAYDEKTGRVLIFDVDREWYEPYWVSEETFFAGMATHDRSSGKNRGLVWIKAKK